MSIGGLAVFLTAAPGPPAGLCLRMARRRIFINMEAGTGFSCVPVCTQSSSCIIAGVGAK